MNEDKTIRLMLGYLCIANEAEASLVRKVQVLDRFELPDAEIAQICGCPVQSIRSARLKVKKSNAEKNQA
jgi:DNA-directed RNA polymerase specialized sigma24 family protein